MTDSESSTPFFLDGDQIRAKTWPLRESIEAYFAHRYGLEQSDGRVCVHDLLEVPCDRRGCRPPGADHASTWTRDGLPAAIVFHPYGITGKGLEALARYCRRRALSLEISGWSWHFPLATLLVIVGRPGLIARVPAQTAEPKVP